MLEKKKLFKEFLSWNWFLNYFDVRKTSFEGKKTASMKN